MEQSTHIFTGILDCLFILLEICHLAYYYENSILYFQNFTQKLAFECLWIVVHFKRYNHRHHYWGLCSLFDIGAHTSNPIFREKYIYLFLQFFCHKCKTIFLRIVDCSNESCLILHEGIGSVLTKLGLVEEINVCLSMKAMICSNEYNECIPQNPDNKCRTTLHSYTV